VSNESNKGRMPGRVWYYLLDFKDRHRDLVMEWFPHTKDLRLRDWEFSDIQALYVRAFDHDAKRMV
jgi:hypothetical protein